MLSQVHPQFDSILMSQYFINQLKESSSVKVFVLGQTIVDTFKYLVKRKRIWDDKRREIKMIYSDWTIRIWNCQYY